MKIGTLRHLVTVQNPAAPVSDGDGSYTQTPADAEPDRVWASITPATARELERVAAGTVISTATHIVRMRFHAAVTTQSRLLFGSRVFHVTGVANPEERSRETIALCAEVVS